MVLGFRRDALEAFDDGRDFADGVRRRLVLRVEFVHRRDALGRFDEQLRDRLAEFRRGAGRALFAAGAVLVVAGRRRERDGVVRLPERGGRLVEAERGECGAVGVRRECALEAVQLGDTSRAVVWDRRRPFARAARRGDSLVNPRDFTTKRRCSKRKYDCREGRR